MTSHGELVESGADGVPFGLLPDSEYGPANEFALGAGRLGAAGDRRTVRVDQCRGRSYGLERLRESILRLASASADDMIRGLYDAARQFVGDVPQDDDVTIVVVRRTTLIAR